MQSRKLTPQIRTPQTLRCESSAIRRSRRRVHVSSPRTRQPPIIIATTTTIGNPEQVLFVLPRRPKCDSVEKNKNTPASSDFVGTACPRPNLRLKQAIANWRAVQHTLRQLQRLSRAKLFKFLRQPKRRKRLGKNMLAWPKRDSHRRAQAQTQSGGRSTKFGTPRNQQTIPFSQQTMASDAKT